MSSKYAVVVGGKVVNTVLWDGATDWQPSEGEVVLLVGGADVGWDYADGEFVDNRPPAEDEPQDFDSAGEVAWPETPQ